MISRPRVALAMRNERLRDALFPTHLRRRLDRLAECDFSLVIKDFADVPSDTLATVDVLLTGWGAPRIDSAALANMPRLKLIAHAAGTVKAHVDPACWDHGITVTTAAAANALPVAEFTLAQILLAGKAALKASHLYRQRQSKIDTQTELHHVGNYERIVGIVGASTIGRLLMERLQAFDLDIALYDPTITATDAELLGAKLVDLDELMRMSDIVSIHAPLLPETVGMIGAAQLGQMRDGSTLINTARGKLVDHRALRDQLMTGRIYAFLDVTDPEPLNPGDPLFNLPNVQLTPHIAGSLGTELHRMTFYALDEIENFAQGVPARYPVRREDLSRMA